MYIFKIIERNRLKLRMCIQTTNRMNIVYFLTFAITIV